MNFIASRIEFTRSMGEYRWLGLFTRLVTLSEIQGTSVGPFQTRVPSFHAHLNCHYNPWVHRPLSKATTGARKYDVSNVGPDPRSAIATDTFQLGSQKPQAVQTSNLPNREKPQPRCFTGSAMPSETQECGKSNKIDMRASDFNFITACCDAAGSVWCEYSLRERGTAEECISVYVCTHVLF
jgi:hypothetical protein